MMITPSYKGAARLLIESRGPNLSGQPASANDPVLDALNITSQAELLRSSDLIRQVAGELHLYEMEEPDPKTAAKHAPGEARAARTAGRRVGHRGSMSCRTQLSPSH